MGRLTAIVLGSAAGGAFPQWNCRCLVCALAWAGDSRVRPRTQTALAVSAGDGRWTLINASPDLPSQIRATPALYPQGELRGSPIDGRRTHWRRNRPNHGASLVAGGVGFHALRQ